MARKLGSHGTYVEARAFRLARAGFPRSGSRVDLRCGHCLELTPSRRSAKALDFAGSAFVVADCRDCGATNALKDRHGNYVRHGNPSALIVLRAEELAPGQEAEVGLR